MKASVKRFISTLLALCFGLVLVFKISAKDQDTGFKYQTGPNDPEWETRSIEENREALIIPDAVLKDLSEEDLYQAFITYPFLLDYMAYANEPVQERLDEMKPYFSAYQEIARRGLSISELALNYNLNKAEDSKVQALDKKGSLDKDDLEDQDLYTVDDSYKGLFDSEAAVMTANEVVSDIVSYELENNPELLDRLAASVK